jgi:hypothetical protein
MNGEVCSEENEIWVINSPSCLHNQPTQIPHVGFSLKSFTLGHPWNFRHCSYTFICPFGNCCGLDPPEFPYLNPAGWDWIIPRYLQPVARHASRSGDTCAFCLDGDGLAAFNRS